MGWLQIRYVNEQGQTTKIIQYGDDPLADRYGTPKHGYWQDPEASCPLSTVEEEDGL